MATLIDPDHRVHDPEPAAIEVLFKEARQRQRRRRQFWAVVIVCVALVVTTVLLVTVGSSPSKRTPVRPPAGAVLPAGTPADIVAWTSDSQLVVVATKSGAVVRTLASSIELEAPGLPTLSVAPDGEVYFDAEPIAGISPENASGDQIFRVPITGGPIAEVSPGFDPQVSPNGDFLAYVSSGGSDEAPYLAPAGGIAIAGLANDSAIDVQTLHPGSRQLNQGVSDLSWSPDSQRLSFDSLDGSTDTTTSWSIEPSIANGSLSSAASIPLSPSGLVWDGYWKGAPNRSVLGLGVLTSGSGGAAAGATQKVVTIDPTTGRVVAPLFSVPAAVCTPFAPPSVPSDCTADFTNALSADSVGSSVLVAGAVPFAGGSVTTSGSSYLYRWSTGARGPVKLKEGVLVAAWGPPSD